MDFLVTLINPPLKARCTCKNGYGKKRETTNILQREILVDTCRLADLKDFKAVNEIYAKCKHSNHISKACIIISLRKRSTILFQYLRIRNIFLYKIPNLMCLEMDSLE